MENFEKKYKDVLRKATKIHRDDDEKIKHYMEVLFPELAESEDERIRKAIIEFFELQDDNTTYSFVPKKDILAWLEKQAVQKSIINVPPREVILSIWDLGNEWKELTNGCISAEYGTQLDYIQKHWHESEYYLREKQGEQKPAWSEEDEHRVKDAIYFLDTAKKHYASTVELDACIDWLKSLRPQTTWKPSDEQMKVLNEVLNFAANHESPYWNYYIFETLNSLIRQLKLKV